MLVLNRSLYEKKYGTEPSTRQQRTARFRASCADRKDQYLPTLSGRSTLTYQVGTDMNSVCLIRVQANSGGGIFNEDWIDLGLINSLLEKHPEDKAVTSYLVRQNLSKKKEMDYLMKRLLRYYL